MTDTRHAQLQDRRAASSEWVCLNHTSLQDGSKDLNLHDVLLLFVCAGLVQESDVEGQVKMLVLDQASGHKASDTTNKNWSLARGVTAAAAAAARAAASRAAGAVGNIKARMAEASAANAAAQAAAGEQAWQVYEGMGAGGSEDGGSSAPDDDWR